MPLSPSCHRSARLGAALAVVAVLLSTPVPASAADSPPEVSADSLKRAREQFSQALALQTAGDWAGALALLKEVAAVKSTPQVRFNIALCEEKLGRLVAALGDYELAAADARAERAEQVAEEVEARLENLRQRIPKLVLRRGAGADAAIIAVDGVSVGDQVIGTPMPTDPGPHTVEARAPGYKPFRTAVRLAEQQTEAVEITLEAEPLPPPPVAPAGAPRVEGRSRLPGYVIGGIGVASLGASAVFLGLRASKISELERKCEGLACPASAQADIDAGKTYSTLVNVTAIVGVAALAGGLVLVLTSGPSKSTAVALGPAPGGVQLLGKF